MDLGRLVGWGVWSGFSWLKIGSLAGCCECGDEPSGSGAMELVSQLDIPHINTRKTYLDKF
jgi:hypothetical protein